MQVNLAWIQYLVSGFRIQVSQHFLGRLHGTAIADDTKCIASIIYLHPETAFNLAQVIIELTAQVGKPLIIGGFENNIGRMGAGTQNKDRDR